MNCQLFEHVVNDLAQEQMMEATVREQATAHSAACPSCARRLDDERELTRKLREYSGAVRAQTASSTLEACLLAEFRKQRVSLATPQATSRYWWSAIAAAVILAFVSLAASRSSLFITPSQTSSSKTAVVDAPAPEPDKLANVTPAVDQTPASTIEVGVTIKPKQNRKRVSSPRSTTKNSRETIAANLGGEEITTEFIPIGYANPANVQDGGQLVRIEMPRSAMARFGLPVNMDRFDERVKADVLVGVDGLARAIRFVQ